MIFLNQIQHPRISRKSKLNTFEQHTFLIEIFIILTYVIYQIWCSTLSPCLRKIRVSIIQLFHFIKIKNFNLHFSQQRESSINASIAQLVTPLLCFITNVKFYKYSTHFICLWFNLCWLPKYCKALWSIYNTNSLGIE